MLAHLTGWPFVVVMAVMFAAIFGIVHGTALLLDRLHVRRREKVAHGALSREQADR